MHLPRRLWMEDRSLVPSIRLAATGRWSWVLPVLLAGFAAILMRLPGLGLPLERDEGAYGLIASLWLKGALPYRDIFDHKPPLIYLLYMPAVAGTPGPVPVRAWQTCLFLLQLPLLHLIGRRVYGHTAAGLATVLYAVAGSAFHLQGLIFNTEQALMLPALGALWALVCGVDDDRVRWPLFYGFCLGLISLIKPTPVPLLLLLVPAFHASSTRTRLRDFLAVTGAMFAPWLPVLGYWGSAGALGDLRFALLDYNRIYAAESAARWTTTGLVDMLAPFAPLLVCAPGGIVAGKAEGGTRSRMIVLLWTLALLAAGLLGLRPYIHYYYPALPGLALLAAPTVVFLARQALQTKGSRRLVAASGPALLLGLLLVPFVLGNLWLVGRTPEEQATALYGPGGQHYFSPAQDVAAYITTATTPDESIYVWASEPELYLFSTRRPASRFIYDYPLQLLPDARVELQRDLLRNPPALIVTYHGAQPAGLATIAERQGLRLTATIEGYDLWTRSADRQP